MLNQMYYEGDTGTYGADWYRRDR